MYHSNLAFPECPQCVKRRAMRKAVRYSMMALGSGHPEAVTLWGL